MADLARIAHQLRVDVLEMVHRAGTGHMGGSYSIAELLTALYFCVMRIDPRNPGWKDRDRLVLSKGHAAPMLYAALARRGYFPAEALDTLRQMGSILQGHPDMKRTPGVDITSGCLGEGLSNGCGFAAAAKLEGRDNHVFVILGDGELQEGQIWEAALFAADKRLDNLTAVVDCNGLMCDDRIDSILPLGDVKARWESFGWETVAVDGHDLDALCRTLADCRAHVGAPRVVLMQTVKGKGVSFMENDPAWHGAIVTDALYARALAELEGGREA